MKAFVDIKFSSLQHNACIVKVTKRHFNASQLLLTSCNDLRHPTCHEQLAFANIPEARNVTGSLCDMYVSIFNVCSMHFNITLN